MVKKEKQLRGLGGWLILIQIGFIGSFIRIFLGFVVNPESQTLITIIINIISLIIVSYAIFLLH